MTDQTVLFGPILLVESLAYPLMLCKYHLAGPATNKEDKAGEEAMTESACFALVLLQ